jgi:hypothetical protein
MNLKPSKEGEQVKKTKKMSNKVTIEITKEIGGLSVGTVKKANKIIASRLIKRGVAKIVDSPEVKIAKPVKIKVEEKIEVPCIPCEAAKAEKKAKQAAKKAPVKQVAKKAPTKKSKKK